MGIVLKSCLLWKRFASIEKNLYLWNKQPGFLCGSSLVQIQERLTLCQATIYSFWGQLWNYLKYYLLHNKPLLHVICFLLCPITYGATHLQGNLVPRPLFFGFIHFPWKSFTPTPPNLHFPQRTEYFSVNHLVLLWVFIFRMTSVPISILTNMYGFFLLIYYQFVL